MMCQCQNLECAQAADKVFLPLVDGFPMLHHVSLSRGSVRAEITRVFLKACARHLHFIEN